MSELKLMQHPEITELLSVLEQNGLHKEQGEVKCLAAYIDEMEGQLSAMNEELMQMHREISTIRDSSLKVRCEKLISSAEKQLRQAATAIRTVKHNCLCMSDVTIKANDQPTDPTTPVTPATGDNQPVVLWFGSVLISGAAILLLAQKKKKVR